MTDVFKCRKSGTTCCAPKSRIHEVQMMHRNDTYPQFVGPQQQQQIPQYLPNNYQLQNYQPIPPNNYAPIPNPYQLPIPGQPINNYQPLPSQNNYIPQPQPVPQQSIQQIQQAPIISNNYPVPPQNYPNPNANVYQSNVVNGNPSVNLSPAYSTPGTNFSFNFPKPE